MIDLAAALSAAVSFGAVSYLYLRSAAYSRWIATCCGFLVAIQILVSLTTATLTALLLAMIVYPVAAGAAAFADAQSLRNVVLLSGALAVVQTVNPLGTAMAGIVVPVLIRLQDRTVFRARGVSLLVLLLFIPAGSAALIAYRASAMDEGIAAQLAGNIAQFAAYRPYLEFSDFRVQAIARAIELAAIASPIWITAIYIRSRPSVAIATVCAALIVAVTLAGLLGRPRPIAVAAPALAIPFALALREWPMSHRRASIAISACAVFLTWLCAELAA